MKRYLLSDAVFKYIYGMKENLLFFLNQFFHYIETELSTEEIQISTEATLKKHRISGKEMRSDVLLVSKEAIILLEAYTSLNLEGLKKVGKYISKIDGEQLNEKEKYKSSKKVIGIILADKLVQRYNYKSDEPEYKELPLDVVLYIIDIDKARRMKYYDGENDLFIHHLKLIGEKSNKVRKQIARGSEELMTIAETELGFMNDRKTLKVFNIEEKARTIGYGDGKNDRNIEIAKNMLKDGASIDYISKMTDLKVEEVEKLQ